MGKMITGWLSVLTLLTGGAWWITKSNKLIPYADGEKVIIREQNHNRPYFYGSGFSRSPMGGGLGHGK